MTPANRSCSLFISRCASILIFISSGDLLVNMEYHIFSFAYDKFKAVVFNQCLYGICERPLIVH